jgi:hypothetical protein
VELGTMILVMGPTLGPDNVGLIPNYWTSPTAPKILYNLLNNWFKSPVGRDSLLHV